MKKLRSVLMICMVFLFCAATVSPFAYAYADENESSEGWQPEIVTAVEETPTPTAEPVPEQVGATGGLDWEGLDPAELQPLFPTGTGTVIENVTDKDGREFFTITTEDGSVFYLVIDRTSSTENVYFLNAVSDADLLPLAEGGGLTVTPTPAPLPTVAPEPTATPEPAAKSSGNSGTLLLTLAVALIAGGAGWYFKIYKPKQEQSVEMEDYPDEPAPDYEAEDYGDEAEPYDSEDFDRLWRELGDK